jgi:hypothetical protein
MPPVSEKKAADLVSVSELNLDEVLAYLGNHPATLCA